MSHLPFDISIQKWSCSYSILPYLAIHVSFIFVYFSCYIPECDGVKPAMAEYEPSWLPNAVPYHDSKPWKCIRYKPSMNKSLDNSNQCSADRFDKTKTQKCSRWVFANDEYTIVREVLTQNLY